jgi:hypothetical protein
MTQTKFKRVPFDIELAKKITNKEMKGRIVTRNGRQARIICFDLKNPVWGIIALVLNNINSEDVLEYQNNGCYSTNIGWHELDLLLEVPTYYKDYSNFVPCKWQPCLVRDNDKEDWNISVCKGRNSAGEAIFFPFGCTYEHCLPLSKATERLVNTRMSYEELIQELDAELTATNQEPDAEQTSIIQDVEFEDDKQFDFHEIKTFADACEKLGMKEHLLTGSMGGDREAQGQAQALYKLLIIQRAINNGVWRDKDGWSYYPYWVLYSKENMERMSEEEKQKKGIRQLLSCAAAVNADSSAFRCANAFSRGASTSTYYGFPLCFNSREAAQYAAKQFEDLFFQYYGIKVKE